MAIVFPVAVSNRLAGSAVLIARTEKYLYFATALHLFGEGDKIQIGLPPHGGDCNNVQVYPVDQTPALPATVAAADPLSDLAILIADAGTSNVPRLPAIALKPGLITVGSQVVVLGYPFAPLGSLLETWTPCTVTALGRRRLAPAVEVDELVLSAQGHPGLSGSAVIGRQDGTLYGIFRGALAPPEVIRIGEIGVATDTSVTFATSAHLLHDMLRVAKKASGE